MPEQHSSRARQAAQYTISCTADDIDPPHGYFCPDLPTDWQTILGAAQDLVADGMRCNVPQRGQPVLIHWETFVALRRALGD